jgi:hypothetical protein
MLELFDSQSKNELTPHLKLVVSNPPPPVIEESPPKATNFLTGFTAEIQDKGHPHYTLVACDPFHYLDCEIGLEIRDNEDELEHKAIVCHFPNILPEELDEFVEEDDFLYGMILVQFQMKLLREILLFCSAHEVLSLLIDVEDTPQGHALKIYEKLAAHKSKILTTTGTKIQLLIPTTEKAFDKWMEFTKEINQKFRKALWEEYHTNHAIKNYLKSNPCLKFFR